MIVSCVLEQAIGSDPEGTVVQLEQELADKLIESGFAREATEEDMAGSEATEEVQEDEEGDDNLVEEQVGNLRRNVEDVLIKATEKAVEKATSRVNRPSVRIAADVKTAGHGFRSMGEWALCSVAKQKQDPSAVTRMAKYDRFLHKEIHPHSFMARSMLQKGQMSIAGGSGHQGGDLVPVEWAKELWRLSFENVPDLVGMCTQYAMDNQSMKIPLWVQSSGSAGVTASVIAEANAITDTVGVTATQELDLVKFSILVNITDELLRFSSPYNVEATIKQIAPNRIRFKSNGGVINGTDSQVNLVNNASAVTVSREVAGHFSFNDCLKMNAALFDDFVADAVWLLNQSSTPELYGLGYPTRAASTQFPAFAPGVFSRENLLGAAPKGELLGHPVYAVENCPGLGTRGDLILYSPKSIGAGQTGLLADTTPYLYFNLAVDTFRFLWYADTVSLMNIPYTRADNSLAANIVVLGNSGS